MLPLKWQNIIISPSESKGKESQNDGPVNQLRKGEIESEIETVFFTSIVFICVLR